MLLPLTALLLATDIKSKGSHSGCLYISALLYLRFFCHYYMPSDLTHSFSSPTEAFALKRLKPAVVGMIGAAFISVTRTVFFPSGISISAFSSAGFWIFLGLFAVTTVLAFKKVHPIKIIILSAVIGIGAGYGLGL